MGKPRIIGRLRKDGDRWMLIAPEVGLVLSDSARAIVEKCDGTRDEAQIVSELEEQFASAGDAIANDVRTLLASLRKKALVEDV